MYTRILDNVFLGNIEDALSTFVGDFRDCAIVNVSRDIPIHGCVHPKNCLRIPIDDDPSENLMEHIFPFLQFIKKHKYQNILIHCYAGMSRSVSYVIILLMYNHYLPFDKAYRYVKSLRPFININKGFKNQLMGLKFIR